MGVAVVGVLVGAIVGDAVGLFVPLQFAHTPQVGFSLMQLLYTVSKSVHPSKLSKSTPKVFAALQ